MVHGIRASNPHGLNKGHGLKFYVGSWVWQETFEEGWRIYQSKCCEYSNKDEDNCLKTLHDKNNAKLFDYKSYQQNALLFVKIEKELIKNG